MDYMDDTTLSCTYDRYYFSHFRHTARARIPATPARFM
ncbi:hypothetical protein AC11_1006 [Escherichia coli 6-537-08_S3_C1]|nr:hypothetical protein AC11_1006 [Escherichia coli 6-537-08_S3_C1]KEM84927.1 hypothetical protein AC64_0989 [Escherichia coli 6-537-08_S3_C3]KEN20031.1 hypothetical protein AC39_0983 [Escherichia coli 6-537-08_S3_C2]